jgi:hypothetical protein
MVANGQRRVPWAVSVFLAPTLIALRWASPKQSAALSSDRVDATCLHHASYWRVRHRDLWGGAAASFALLHGAGNSILTITRGTLLLAIFGPENYAYGLD